MSLDTTFAGSIPAIYQRCLVPLLFADYAEEAARRIAAWGPDDILETAAGTGVITRALAAALPQARIVATDLNPGMLETAASMGTPANVTWRQADALVLPFDDRAFDVVACQFGVMFYPDKVRAGREARRVLREGGRYLAIIWDTIERNPVTAAAERAQANVFPESPPTFMSRTPFGYANSAAIEDDLREAGFAEVTIETVVGQSRPISPQDAAIGLCQGSPMRSEIEAHDPGKLDAATAAAAEAIAALGDRETVTTPMSALFVTATR